MARSKQSKEERRKKKEMYKRRKRVKKQATDELKNAREFYATKWSEGDAEHFEENGYYKWMAEFVDDYERVFELGTGDGRGTLELARRNHQIVSVDENPICLIRANEYLRANGISTTLITREEKLELSDSFSITYSPIREIGDVNQVILIQGNILDDHYLLDWITEQRQFDSVVCWLIGSHWMYRNLHKIIDLPIDAGEYRLRVQNRMYELCDQILRPEGILNVIDRTQSTQSTPHLREETWDCHREQASVTSLEVVDVTERPYITPDNGVNMGLTPGTNGEIPEVVELVLCSVTSRKPA